jgi:glucose-6-phosphate 1-dehydrogenase
LDPLIFVIFGASGDLTRRKLLPAIFDLYKGNHLPNHFAVLGISRSDWTDNEFRRTAFLECGHAEISLNEMETARQFADHLFYQSIDTMQPDDYRIVADRLKQLDARFQTGGNIIFYLSTPPSLYELIPEFLAAQSLNQANGSWRRLVIEKPFGYDRRSARNLNAKLRRFFAEEQIYRIDHYLGKETVQNLLVTRFANGIFEPLWNHNYIHHIEITSAEDIGVGDRGGYYDKSGALRDMLQNHLMQVVAHVAMEPPVSPDAESIRAEKTKLFRSLRPIDEQQVAQFAIRGQYLASKMRGVPVPGYRDEPGVPADSKTETYAAVKFFIDNWRWSNVPFFVRTGKRLPTRVTEITITFKKPPHTLFKHESDVFKKNNQLVVRIQPDEGLLLNFGMKIPGAGFRVKNVGMDFHYSDLTDEDVPTAYERLLLDCIKGDATLYAHGDSVEYAWEFVEPILNAWSYDPDIPIYGYPAGSWGPEVADQMLESTEFSWRNPCRRLTDDTSFCEL